MTPRLTRRALGLTALATALPRIGRAAGDTIKIGQVASLTGAAAEIGELGRNGARLALNEVNATGVLGRKLELVVEDDQTSNPGAVLAFSRLAARPDLVAMLGPTRSTQVQAISPDVERAGRPVMIGGSDPSLTQQGNTMLFRCRPSDIYSAKVIAAFGVGDLGKKKWAVVASSDTFGSNGAKALVAELAALGVTPVLVQSYTNQATDYTSVVLAIRQSGADILSSYFTLDTDMGIFARQVRQLGVSIPWVGSAAIASTTALHLAGRALYDTYGVSDYATDASAASMAYTERYQAAYGKVPDFQSAWTYDAVHLLARAMASANATDPQAIRTALAATRDYPGAEGTYNFDDKGDGLRGYNIVHNDNGTIVFSKRIEVKG